MPKYCVITENQIVNLIMADSKEDAELLTGTTCIQQNESFPYGIGYAFDGVKWVEPGTQDTVQAGAEGTNA